MRARIVVTCPCRVDFRREGAIDDSDVMAALGDYLFTHRDHCNCSPAAQGPHPPHASFVHVGQMAGAR